MPEQAQNISKNVIYCGRGVTEILTVPWKRRCSCVAKCSLSLSLSVCVLHLYVVSHSCLCVQYRFSLNTLVTFHASYALAPDCQYNQQYLQPACYNTGWSIKLAAYGRV